MKVTTGIALFCAALAVAGCSRSTTNALSVDTRKPPQPLPSAPSGTVETASLEPPANQLDAPEIPEVPAIETPVVEAEPVAPSNEPLTHEALAGSWDVPSDGSGCKVILSFTQWSGGYRAATRGCQSAELSSVSAWDVKGSRVVLVDTNGNQVANLANVGKDRYAGQTSGGNGVNFTRL